jgi:spore maturation protein CgeB
MRIVIFCHSLVSDWNHGNAHFLRGITTDLQRRGHDVRVYEPRDGWSIQNLRTDYGTEPVDRFRRAFPLLRSSEYDLDTIDLDQALEGAHLVLIHEWNEPELVERIGRHHARGGRYTLLFHDTHHRSVTAPEEMERYRLADYDGVLAFGESVSEQYRRRGWGRRVWTWHEAADHRVFRPLPATGDERDLVWIGNWGDDERTAELDEFLIDPVKALQLRATVHGVRYPNAAKQALAAAGAEFRGWVPNYEVPRVFADHKLTVHVPRRPYASALSGVPTIRIFEALACGIPLISAPWNDSENLFSPGRDFLFVTNGSQMKTAMRTLLNDRAYASELAHHGRQTILSRHTCTHRVDELLDICKEVGGPVEPTATLAGARA